MSGLSALSSSARVRVSQRNRVRHSGPGIVLLPRQLGSARSRHRVLAGLQEGVGNLGQLSQFAGNSATEDLSWAVQRVSPESFANRGLYVDTPVVLASGFLLLLLLALSMQRILGLDRLVAEFMLKQQDERKRNTRAAKESLERTWSQEGRGTQDDPPGTR